jgi:hypothetical protein
MRGMRVVTCPETKHSAAPNSTLAQPVQYTTQPKIHVHPGAGNPSPQDTTAGNTPKTV